MTKEEQTILCILEYLKALKECNTLQKAVDKEILELERILLYLHQTLDTYYDNSRLLEILNINEKSNQIK